LGDLKLCIDGAVREFPHWANFFMSMGQKLVREDENRGLLAVLVPDRTLVSSLIATGVVFESLRHPVSDEEKRDHYEYLRGLPDGTPVTFVSNGRRLRGLLGMSSGDIAVQVDSKRGIKHIFSSPDRAISIQPLRDEISQLPKHQKGYDLNADQDFLTSLYPRRRLKTILSSFTHCTIIGTLNRLELEMDALELAVPSEGQDLTTARLRTLLRPSRWVSVEECSWSTVYSFHGSQSPPDANSIGSPVVLFDGPTAFLKWHTQATDAHSVAVLDRTHSRTVDAIELVADRALTRSGKLNLIQPELIPPGVEIVEMQI
jgi:hypothetical protein